MPTPRHLAIIMDGNGRWAEKRQLPRIAGHQRGVETVRRVIGECCRLQIPYLTLYAFSSENWGRPEEEVSALMGLLSRYLQSELPFMNERRLRLNVIGDTARLPVDVRQILSETVAETATNEGMVLTLALSYGSRSEMLAAVRQLATRVAQKEISAASIDESSFSSSLYTAGLPDPDLVIRTSGEMRVSNFLLWQIAYAELYFTDVLWPDFSTETLEEALAEFARRQRRFGLTADQLPESEEKSH
ncbi:MAG: isoprenyl transferase [Desulfuromonas sp.]|nr:MAG: isoprenyl transferase [Desulfuromonas sp.]